MLVVVLLSRAPLDCTAIGFPCNFGPETDDKEARGGEKTLRNLSYSYVPPFPKTFTE